MTRYAKKENKLSGAPSITIRIRQLKGDFEIVWEASAQFLFEKFDVLDPLNSGISDGILIKSAPSKWYLLRSSPKKENYELWPINAARDYWEGTTPDDIKAARTRKKDVWEYWGYRWSKGQDGKRVKQIQMTYLNQKKTQLVQEDISFNTHDRFIGVGSFSLGDLDGDGLDEIALIEETGLRQGGEGHAYEYKKVMDFIHVLKWNGTKYRTIWTSPPLKTRHSHLIVGSALGNQNNQIIVGTGDGKIQIWRKK